MSTEVTESKQFDLSPRTLDEALKFADYMAKSDLVPKDFKEKPGNCLIAIQWGMELGLKPMQALQNIAVINGRPALWGDAVIALVRASPICEYVTESLEGNVAVCRVKRRGEAEQVRTFSDDDAKAAGLLGKQGPWTQYRNRMKQMRARSYALRDVFPDVLKGIQIAEEVMDIPPERDVTPSRATPMQIAAAAVPEADTSDRTLSMIADLELVAKEQGADAFKAEWKALNESDKAAIGIDERNRILSLAAKPSPTVVEGEVSHE